MNHEFLIPLGPVVSGQAHVTERCGHRRQEVAVYRPHYFPRIGGISDPSVFPIRYGASPSRGLLLERTECIEIHYVEAHERVEHILIERERGGPLDFYIQTHVGVASGVEFELACVGQELLGFGRGGCAAHGSPAADFEALERTEAFE